MIKCCYFVYSQTCFYWCQRHRCFHGDLLPGRSLLWCQKSHGGNAPSWPAEQCGSPSPTNCRATITHLLVEMHTHTHTKCWDKKEHFRASWLLSSGENTPWTKWLGSFSHCELAQLQRCPSPVLRECYWFKCFLRYSGYGASENVSFSKGLWIHFLFLDWLISMLMNSFTSITVWLLTQRTLT